MPQEKQKSAPEAQLPRLNLIQKGMLLRGATDPDYFKFRARPMLYELCKGDPELVHDVVLDSLHKNGSTAGLLLKPFFKPPENLKINFMGRKIAPFGTAAGMDKNAEALAAFGNIFPIQEAGTFVVPKCRGNNRIRVATVEEELDLLNSQGFPSKGVNNAIVNLNDYRKSGGEAVIWASVCGLPLSPENAVGVAMDEMKTLIGTLRHDVQGFVWNPFSPNTEALKTLRKPEVCYETSKLMAEMAPGKLRLLKLGPYEPDEKRVSLGLVEKFLEGGGHGVVTTNTKLIPKDQLPDSVRVSWGYQSAGRSGSFLRSYRLRSVSDIRQAFPESVIVATGGIYNPQDAYLSFWAGANVLEGYTPYTYYGVGLLREIMKGLSKKLDADRFTLGELQDEIALQARLRAR